MRRRSNPHRRLFAFAVSSFWCACCFTDACAVETVVYSEGFESGNGSYTHTGTFDTWEWGPPSANYADGPMAAHSGNKCWGTDLDNPVPFNSNAYLTSPAITLPAIGADSVLRVRFFGWIAIDLMADRGEFQVSSDGIDWETKAELLCVMQGGWNEYAFDISSYAGGTIYLRFRCVADNENAFSPPEVPENMAGFYIDDIAITLVSTPAVKKTLTFEGSESQNTVASCPWIYIPVKKSDTTGAHPRQNGGFRAENDIYSTARGSSQEYTDYYRLNGELPENGVGGYSFKLKETGQEESYTDLLHLIIVEHPADVDIASDGSGNAFTYKKNKISPPVTAVDMKGISVLPMVKDPEEYGYKAFNGDYVDCSFSWNGTVQHPILLLRARGFMTEARPGSVIPVSPKIEVQTQNSGGQWVTRFVFYPRWNTALCGYDLAGLLPYAKNVRLLSSSCMTGKYNQIDWVAVSTESQKSVTVTELAPASAIRSDGFDLTIPLSGADNKYARMIANEEINLVFKPVSGDKSGPSPAVSANVNPNKRDFIIKSKGYYIPTGTYFFYTWNGSAWTLRDGWTVPLDGDQSREFDFSLWLPDPAGQNRVRIWQDYIYDEAAIDYVGLRRDSVDLVMNYATDLRNNASVLNLLNVSDNQRLFWDYGEDWPYRIRWVEAGWADTFVNTPPSTNPVFITNTNLPNPTINWTYFDLDGNPQKRFEVEVWTGPGGTGNNVWDPQPGNGAASTAVYTGASLTPGLQYYARAKAYDSLSWGGWSETAFIVSLNNPPIAAAGPDTVVTAVPTCLTSVELDGSASYDPDGDTLTYLWTGPFGTVSGARVAVSLHPDTARILLIVSDGKGGSGVDSVIIVVRDTIAPAPDSEQLPTISGECRVVITTPPTATDNCAGKILGAADSLVFTSPGTHMITWRFSDAWGNTATQLQTVVVTDNSAPVPSVSALPVLSGECFVAVTEHPTAADACAGTIIGTTADSLLFTEKGTYTINWRYDDGGGNVTLQTQSVVVTDGTAPVPNVPQLPVLQNNCVLSVGTIPTATDNCKGLIFGTTPDPLWYPQAGTYTIHWNYHDGNGNTSSQTQTVIVVDTTAPVPSVDPLPPINGTIVGTRCYTVRTYPTAMDNCKGRIVGTTTSPLTYCYRGTFTIVWRFSDGNGNTATQNQTVNIQ